MDYSPDRRSSLVITATELPDLVVEWKYRLVLPNQDTVMLTSTHTHDESRPVTYWDKSSTRLVYEDRGGYRVDLSKIKVYNLMEGKDEFETSGFVWGDGKYNFDEGRGLLHFFTQREGSWGSFNLMVLDITTKEIRKLHSLVTSVDPITGVPWIDAIDTVERTVIVKFEGSDMKIVSKVIGY